jgi:hypothetical protein
MTTKLAQGPCVHVSITSERHHQYKRRKHTKLATAIIPYMTQALAITSTAALRSPGNSPIVCRISQALPHGVLVWGCNKRSSPAASRWHRTFRGQRLAF